MNSKPLIQLLLVVCFALGFSSLYAGEDQKAAMRVKKITFASDKIGGEWISIFCDQACVPVLSSLGGENPRVVMDMKGVFLIQTKTRNISTGGKLVKRIRSYLDKETKILRVVLDLEPSKHYIAHPRHDPPENAYVIMIYEDILLSQQKSQAGEGAKGPALSQEKRITILQPYLTQEERQEGEQHEAAPSPEKRTAASAATAQQSIDQGRSQLNAGEYSAAVDTFTQVLAAHPQDSLSYSLRGTAYDNMGDRKKALEDWAQAARLGDTFLQSYLDFQQVKWRENPAPSRHEGVRVIGNRDSKRYHLPGMKYYDLVKAYHRVVFQSEQEAIQAGYHRAPK